MKKASILHGCAEHPPANACEPSVCKWWQKRSPLVTMVLGMGWLGCWGAPGKAGACVLLLMPELFEDAPSVLSCRDALRGRQNTCSALRGMVSGLLRYCYICLGRCLTSQHAMVAPAKRKADISKAEGASKQPVSIQPWLKRHMEQGARPSWIF